MLNAQAVGRPGNQRIEYAVAGKPKNVVDIVVFGPFHHFVTAIVTITPPDDARLRPVLAYPARDMLDDRPHLRALRCLGGPQDRHQRRAAPHMIDMHGGKAALVLVCIPERKLLTTMRRAECRRCRGSPLSPASRSSRTDRQGPPSTAQPPFCAAHSLAVRSSIARPVALRPRDSDQPQPSSADRASIGRSRCRPCSRT